MTSTTLTHPEWNKKTGGLEVAKAFAHQIRGKNVLITGVSPESIGSSIALSLASQAPQLLILASRTSSKLEEVLKTVRKQHLDVHIAIVSLDLMSQESVRDAAKEIASLADRLDLIINNAGAMTQQRTTTKEGIEGQFGACHIGHFLLTNLLVPQLLAAAKSNSPGATRVINLTSLGHRISPVRFSDYNLTGKDVPPEEKNPGSLPPMFEENEADGYNGWVAYGQAKTANILFSIGLNEKLRGKGVSSYAVHPGCNVAIWTGLSRNLDEEGEAAIRKTSTFWKNRNQGAATVIVAALDPVLDESKGVLLHDCQMCDAAPHATDAKMVEKLWSLSEKLVKSECSL
ncbi:hypothetical protein BDU57DRAFT_446811 [Ampelomyces quisqualis]|uniref:NAD(P)-binding protein n=1 Tax=Ampelomyces quisqualis TaxID=50730 RepID=A0A6A5QUS0_AMPQU|nr:hypothetical protein BDU57DRAFT_446811 [Ampelomyces quisqualis]